MKRIQITYFRKRIFRVAASILIIAAIIIFVRAFISSLFVGGRDSISVVVFDNNPSYYILGLSDKINYFIPFAADAKIIVPGGYKNYRFGALGKLVELEKNPDLYRRAFASATSTFTNYYFYTPKTEIYYGRQVPQTTTLPSILKLMTYKSNASFFDRIFIAFAFIGRDKADFTLMDQFAKGVGRSDKFFQGHDFAKSLQGYFYRRTYRNENKTVQIKYTKSYLTASTVGQIIEGNGIRVVDLGEVSDMKVKRCLVIESGGKYSHTARDIAQYFACGLSQGDASISDIIVELGSQTEQDWNVE